MRVIRYVIIIISVIGVMCSCTDDLLFSEVRKVEGESWNVDSVMRWDVEVMDGLAEDTLCAELLLRHTGNYAYQNVWLFVECLGPDSVVYGDTINVMVADVYGRWMGKGGIGSLYTVTAAIGEEWMKEPGTYCFAVRHGMRMEEVMGITDIGLCVYKSKCGM